MTDGTALLRKYVENEFRPKYKGGSTLIGGKPIFPDKGGEPVDVFVGYIKTYLEDDKGKAACPNGKCTAQELMNTIDQQLPTAERGRQTMAVLRIAAAALPPGTMIDLTSEASIRKFIEPLSQETPPYEGRHITHASLTSYLNNLEREQLQAKAPSEQLSPTPIPIALIAPAKGRESSRA